MELLLVEAMCSSSEITVILPIDTTAIQVLMVQRIDMLDNVWRTLHNSNITLLISSFLVSMQTIQSLLKKNHCLITFKITRVFNSNVFVGELCDERRAFYECGFGYHKCLARRCYGYLAGENCINSADCNPHLYCDLSDKTCKYAKQAEEQCISSD